MPDLAGHLVEEAYEVLDAAASGQRGPLEEELGDACFLLALVQAAAEEEGAASMEAILERVLEKILRRHPHVFARKQTLDPRSVILQWEAAKRAERGIKEPAAEETGFRLAPPPPALPALLQALRLQEKAAAVGFDWPDTAPVLEKIREELGELEEAMRHAQGAAEGAAAGALKEHLREELGDLLFSVVNLARWLRLNPEATLRQASRKFHDRFNRMAALAEEAGSRIESMNLEEMDRYWEAAKAAGRERPGDREA